MESKGSVRQEEESSVIKEGNNGDGKSKSGQISYERSCKQLSDEAHMYVDEAIDYYDHDLVKLKALVNIIIDLNSEVKAEFYAELRRKGGNLMKSGRFGAAGKKEVDLTIGRPIQQTEPNENEILKEETSKKKGHKCTGRYCHTSNCKRREALINKAHADVDECISLLQHDMEKLRDYISQIVHLKTDIKCEYWDEVKQKEKEERRRKRCRLYVPDDDDDDEEVIAESSKPKRMCKRCGEYARHDSRNCPLKNNMRFLTRSWSVWSGAVIGELLLVKPDELSVRSSLKPWSAMAAVVTNSNIATNTHTSPTVMASTDGIVPAQLN
ncbi:hypothetical protein OSB04_018247 [Centaurea solstitialis]|uniref:Uncharacterized protein n=1 Tax=Centaurea solstitialis TaxID=347529 RepID=A0AA38TMH6_9ASTR|nr:hypothetical protein OSB04_018247 [Centaurea solstitialis]